MTESLIFSLLATGAIGLYALGYAFFSGLFRSKAVGLFWPIAIPASVAATVLVGLLWNYCKLYEWLGVKGYQIGQKIWGQSQEDESPYLHHPL